jgi:hypothetical protein
MGQLQIMVCVCDIVVCYIEVWAIVKTEIANMLMLGIVQKVTIRLLLVWDAGLYSKRGPLVDLALYPSLNGPVIRTLKLKSSVWLQQVILQYIE